jgi:hypothetical protein
MMVLVAVNQRMARLVFRPTVAALIWTLAE